MNSRLVAIIIKKHQTVFSASIVLAVTFALSAVLGFLRSRFLYAHFFQCCVLELDAYNAAFRIPDLIFKLLVSGALSASFIPVFSASLKKEPKDAYRLASTVVNLLLICFIIIATLAAIFTKELSGLIASGFNPDQIELMASLSRILLISQIFFLVSNFFTAILQVNEIFFVPALSPIIYNLVIIASIFLLAPFWGIWGVVWGCVIGSSLHFLIQIPSIRHIGFKYTFNFDFRLKGVREVIRLMLPRSLSLGLGEIENTATLFFASSLSAGSISILNLAMQLMYLPSRIFGTTLGQASLPILSKRIANNDIVNFRSILGRTLRQSLYIAFPVTILILVNRLSIIRLLFGARAFPWSATVLTARTLAFLAPAIIFQAIIQILVRAFYALHDTRTPLKVSFVSLFFSLSSAWYLINFTDLGIVGLAISASLGNFVQCFGLCLFFLKKIDGLNLSSVYYYLIKLLLASLFSGSVSWLTMRLIDSLSGGTFRTYSLMINLFFSLSFGLIGYYVLSHLLKMSEALDYQRRLNKLLPKTASVSF
ncbi:MAG: murein biosynthesis integral membrane protein MurJ [Candidatus Shapirobacteria bacterium]